MTIDADGRGYRIREVELPLEPPGHRAHARRASCTVWLSFATSAAPLAAGAG